MGETTDRTEWLREFQQAHRDAQDALGALGAQISTIHDAGLNGVAATLGQPLLIAEESVAAMDDAVSRMIGEDFEHSLRTTDEMFIALLKSTMTVVDEGSKLEP